MGAYAAVHESARPRALRPPSSQSTPSLARALSEQSLRLHVWSAWHQVVLRRGSSLGQEPLAVLTAGAPRWRC